MFISRAQGEQVATALLMVDGEHAVGKDERGVRRLGAMTVLAAGLGLQFVAEAADVAEVECERHDSWHARPALTQLTVQEVEERPRYPGAYCAALEGRSACRDVVRHVLGERPAPVAHEREAGKAV